MKVKLSIIMLALAVASNSLLAYATESESTDVIEDEHTVIDPYRGIPVVPGETSVGLQVTETLPSQLSFEVPLYITAAVVDGQSEVIVPDNYGIKNNTINSNSDEIEIAVTKVLLTAFSTKDYWTLTNYEPTLENEMQITLGGIPLIDPTEDGVLMDLTDSMFYDKETEKFNPIPYGVEWNIPIVANVLNTFRLSENQKAVAQFKVEYSVSLLDTNGEPIGVDIFYEGDTPWD